MKIKNSAISLTEIGLYMVLGFAIFTGMYAYLGTNIEDAGLTEPGQLGDTEELLINQSVLLDNHLANISVAFTKATQAESSAFAVWNGMVGIGSMLTLPITLVGIGVTSFSSLIIGDYASYIPLWLVSGISVALMIIILFAVIGALKGESRM